MESSGAFKIERVEASGAEEFAADSGYWSGRNAVRRAGSPGTPAAVSMSLLRVCAHTAPLFARQSLETL